MDKEYTMQDYTNTLRGKESLVEKTARFLAEQMKWYERYDNLSPEMKEYYKERAAKIIEFVRKEDVKL